MVAPGEQVSLTLKREFSEETMNSLELPEDEVKTIAKKVDATFQKGKEVRPVNSYSNRATKSSLTYTYFHWLLSTGNVMHCSNK